jgi:murein DD-endopeptidase MepM/ murein hydrolase activator NlpD
MLRAIAIAALLAALIPGVARGAPWRWPVRGRIVGFFTLSPDAPYAAGRRRGIAIRASPGSSVVSACAGRVAFAGSVGRAGPTLSVVCGALRATYQGLRAITLRHGSIVLPGAPVGVVGPAGVLRLGARVEGGARGPLRYTDPARLLGDPPRRLPPLGRAPRPGAHPFRPTEPRPVLRPPSVAIRDPGPEARPARAPTVAWLGLGVLAAATPVGALTRRRRRKRRIALASRALRLDGRP